MSGAIPTKWFPWPRQIGVFICGTVFGAFGGFLERTVLLLFIQRRLGFSENSATELYHGYNWLACLMPIWGGIVSDSFLGKFKTIVYSVILIVISKAILTASALPVLSDHAIWLAVIALVTLAVAGGGPASCSSAFVGDQFKLPEENKQLAKYYSFSYWLSNMMIFLSILVAPKFREVQCYGSDCYSLNFGISTMTSLAVGVLYVCTRTMFVKKPPTENMVVEVSKCVQHALEEKQTLTSEKTKRPEHWLDYAEGRHDPQLIKDIKQLLQLCVLFVPIPLYWALFEQQGSRWTFQATRMRGEAGFFGYFKDTIILPDQTQLLNPLLIVLQIPFFDAVVYPIFAKFGMLKKPLQRMTVGGFLAALSFFISAALELKIQAQYPSGLNVTESSMHFINAANCPLSLHLQLDSGLSESKYVRLDEMTKFDKVPPNLYQLKVTSESAKCAFSSKTFTVAASPGLSRTYVLWPSENGGLEMDSANAREYAKSANGSCELTFFYHGLSPNETGIHLDGKIPSRVSLMGSPVGHTGTVYLQSHQYHISLEPSGQHVGEFFPRLEGVYAVVLTNNTLRTYTLIEPNNIHMAWIVPQYFVITASEVMFSVTSMNFIYSQAPESMKSVVQAMWLLTSAFGNLIVLGIAQANFFHNDIAKEFSLYAIMMAITMVAFAFLAWRFQPISDGGEDHIHEVKYELNEVSKVEAGTPS